IPDDDITNDRRTLGVGTFSSVRAHIVVHIDGLCPCRQGHLIKWDRLCNISGNHPAVLYRSAFSHTRTASVYWSGCAPHEKKIHAKTTQLLAPVRCSVGNARMAVGRT